MKRILTAIIASILFSQVAYSGFIVGTVTDASDGSAIASAELQVRNFNTGVNIGTVTTDDYGNYIISGLATGNYRVFFVSDNFYMTQYYNETVSSIDSEPISVVEGQYTTGIDFKLVEGGYISGRVVDQADETPQLIRVTAYDYDSGRFRSSSLTDSNGYYTISAIPSGNCRVSISSQLGFLDQHYDNESNSDDAIPVSVALGETTSGIDFALIKGCNISGRVTDLSSGTPQAYISVSVYDNDSGDYLKNDYTDTLGNYYLNNLPAGNYRVMVYAQKGFITQYFNNKFTVDDTDPVVGIQGETVTDIDFALVEGGTITGTVTEKATDTPMRVYVVLYNFYSWTQPKSVYSDVNGNYSFSGLTAGDYRVEVYSQNGFLKQNYNNKLNTEDADPVNVVHGGTTSGIDFALVKAGSITGRVIDKSSGLPLSDVSVNARDYDDTSVTSQYAGTDADGYYTLSGLTTGNYIVSVSSQQGYVSQYYDNVYDSDDADAVSVVEGEATGGVDFELSVGGSISGRVTNQSNGFALYDIVVRVYDYDSGDFLAAARTDGNGNYLFSGLATGDCRVSVSSQDGFMEQHYNNKSSSSDADIVTVSSGATTWMIDFALSMGGVINGRVLKNSDGSPVSSITVYANNYSTGDYGGSGVTDENGNYSISGLPAGYYRVNVYSQQGFIGQYYNSQTDYSSANMVSVSQGVTTWAVDFSLLEGGVISGSVTDESDGSVLAGMTVYAENISTNYSFSAVTDSNGNYSINALATGSYRVSSGGQDNYLPEYYDGKSIYYYADPIAVVDGVTSSGVDIALTQGGMISGTVTDQLDGIPLENASVRIYDYDTGNHLIGVFTDVNGSYTASSLPAGDYKVVAAMPGYATQYYDNTAYWSSADRVSVATGLAASGIDFPLAREGKISGRVIEESSGLAMPYVWVSAYDFDSGNNSRGVWTDVDGNYTLDGLSAGSYRVQVDTQENYLSEYYNNSMEYDEAEPVIAVSGETTDGIDFEITEGGSISGRVLGPDGLPVENITILFFENVTDDYLGGGHTNVDGYYTIYRIPAGSYALRTYAPGSEYLTQHYDHTNYYQMRAAVAVGEGEDVNGIDFDLEFGVSISGTITAPDGTAVENAEVTCYSWHDSLGSVSTDPNGQYTVNGLMPNQDYRLAAYPRQGSSYAITPAEFSVSNESLTGADIQLNPDGITVSGIVSAKSTGEPVGDTRVFVHIDDSAYEFYGGHYDTEPNGFYQIENLPAVCGVEVIVESSNYARAEIELCLSEDQLGVNFELFDESSLSGFVIDMQTGEPVANVAIECWSELYDTGSWSTTDANGRFTIEGLSPGICEVIAMPDVSSGYAWSMPSPSSSVNLPEGGDVENRYVAVQKGALVTGRFVEADGNTGIGFADFDFSTQWSEGWGETGSDGEFTMRLPVGNYGIALEVDDDMHSKKSMTIEVPDLMTDVSLGKIVMYSESDGEQISGAFSNPESIPIAGEVVVLAFNAGVSITPDKWGWYWETSMSMISDSGEYAVNSLPPGNYDLYLLDFNMTEEGLESGSVKDIVYNVAAGAAGPELVYGSQGGSVSGSIVNVDGEAVVGGQVILNDLDTGYFIGFAQSGSDGQFVIDKMVPGNYTISVTHRMYQPVVSTVIVVEGEVTTVPIITLDFAGVRQGGDINGDGLVGIGDLSVFAGQWFNSAGDSDFDEDGIVGIADFNVIGQMWMSQAVWRNN